MRHTAPIPLALLAIALCACDQAPAPAPVAPTPAPRTVPPLSFGSIACPPHDADHGGFTVAEFIDGDRLRLKIPATLASLDLVKLPAGVIDMPAIAADGKLDPSRRQTVAIQPFWIATTETTWDIYDGFRAEHEGFELAATLVPFISRPSRPYMDPSFGLGRGGYPAIGLTTDNCRLFCAWLSARTGRKYRLPTEAEWEYACRAGRLAMKLTKEELLRIAWVRENSAMPPDGDGIRPLWLEQNDEPSVSWSSRPVATKPANAFGLYDMLGNVGEWALGADGVYVQKGGSWAEHADRANPTARTPYTRDWQLRDPSDPRSTTWLSDAPHVGFRLVREMD